MPYLVLAIGVLIGLYALYRFFMKADIKQIKALFLTSVIVVLSLALFFMAITGRLPAALALLAAITPFAIGLWKIKQGGGATKDSSSRRRPGSSSNGNKPLTRKEALEVLGLKDNATQEDIKDAYKKLIKKVHPDHEGSEWMSTKLNEARDLLLKQK